MTRPARQSFVRCPLTDILATSGQVRVLRVLALHGGALAPARVAQAAGLTAPGVRLALAALVRTQVVTILGSGRTQLYQIDRAHPIATSVRVLFLNEAKHWEALLGALRPLLSMGSLVESTPPPLAAWYYGSAARGEDDPESDFDLVIVLPSEATAEAAAALGKRLDAIGRRFRVTLSPVMHTPQSLMELEAVGNAWLANVVQEGKSLRGPAPADFLARIRQPARDQVA